MPLGFILASGSPFFFTISLYSVNVRYIVRLLTPNAAERLCAGGISITSLSTCTFAPLAPNRLLN